MHGCIQALNNFPSERAVEKVLDSLIRLDNHIFAVSYLAKHFTFSHSLFRVQINKYNSKKLTKKDKQTFDKLAEVLVELERFSYVWGKTREKEYAEEAKVLFRDIATKCNEKQFKSLINYFLDFFTASEVEELIKIVAIRFGAKSMNSSIEEYSEIINNSKKDIGFLLKI